MRQALAKQLKQVSIIIAIMKIDMHNHTVFSDSTATPYQLVKAGKEKGIIPIITDHNTMAAEKEAKEASKKLSWPFIIGEEIKTSEGEIIGLMLNEAIPRGLSPGETLDRIKEQGAISYAPHPFSFTRFGIGGNLEILGKIDIIEVINARASRITDNKALDFAKRNKKIMGAGSDSHWLGGFGRAYVETKDIGIATPQGLLDAARRGRPVLAKRVSKLENLYNRIRRTLRK